MKFPVELFLHFQEKFVSFLKGAEPFNREDLSLCIQVLKLSDNKPSLNLDTEVILKFIDNLKYPEQLAAVALAVKC